jgi:hypothetical protein
VLLMPAFRLVEIDKQVIVILGDERVVTAFKTLEYAWKERPENSHRVDALVDGLNRIFELLSACA